jgi:cobalt-zinc-cadmium efflux system outer membrane protein
MARLSIRPSHSPVVRRRPSPAGWVYWLLTWGVLAGRAGAQGPTVETSVPTLPGSATSLMGRLPGSGGSTFSNLPGEGGILSGRPGPTTPKGIPGSITLPGTAASPTALQDAVVAPQPEPVTAAPGPTYGTLEIPSGDTTDEDNPPDGLDLEQIIDVTLQRSLDLRSKFYEIPMARADVLQAGLRANPIFYQDGQLLQYQRGEFNRGRPGGPQQFDTNVTIPLDVSHKRLARIEVTTRAEKVLEAAYQEAVRQRIDDVYDAYVAALSARQTARYARASVEGLERLNNQVEQLFKGLSVPRMDVLKVRNQLRTTRLRLLHAQADYRKALIDLGALMNLSAEELDRLKLRGSIVVPAPLPPPLEDLKQIALAERPDVVAYRLGIARAQSDVRLARANAYSDVYVLWQPYTFQDNSPYGLKSATSWALGVTVPLPIFNRNQGGIERAKINVTQSHVQLADVERQARVDVAKALQDLEVNRREVEELRDRVVPDAGQALKDVRDLLTKGERSYSDYLNAQLDYNQIVEQYLDTAIRYRRSMLAINTVTGKRIMP